MSSAILGHFKGHVLTGAELTLQRQPIIIGILFKVESNLLLAVMVKSQDGE